MFTGLIEQVGRVEAVAPGSLSVRCSLSLPLGGSIAVNGVCLTVAEIGDVLFRADISRETAALTTLTHLPPGAPVNLERPVKVDGRLGGHIVQGHVDSIGKLSARDQQETGAEFWFEVEPEARRYLVPKGSVAVDGVSLTVARLSDTGFSVALVPHTLRSTNLGEMQPPQTVNIETDILARYVEHMLDRSTTDSREGT